MYRVGISMHGFSHGVVLCHIKLVAIYNCLLCLTHWSRYLYTSHRLMASCEFPFPGYKVIETWISLFLITSVMIARWENEPISVSVLSVAGFNFPLSRSISRDYPWWLIAYAWLCRQVWKDQRLKPQLKQWLKAERLPIKKIPSILNDDQRTMWAKINRMDRQQHGVERWYEVYKKSWNQQRCLWISLVYRQQEKSLIKTPGIKHSPKIIDLFYLKA